MLVGRAVWFRGCGAEATLSQLGRVAPRAETATHCHSKSLGRGAGAPTEDERGCSARTGGAPAVVGRRQWAPPRRAALSDFVLLRCGSCSWRPLSRAPRGKGASPYCNIWAHRKRRLMRCSAATAGGRYAKSNRMGRHSPREVQLYRRGPVCRDQQSCRKARRIAPRRSLPPGGPTAGRACLHRGQRNPERSFRLRLGRRHASSLGYAEGPEGRPRRVQARDGAKASQMEGSSCIGWRSAHLVNAGAS